METEREMSKVGLLRELPAEARARLAPHARLVTLRRGERLWTEGRPSDAFSFVTRGHLKLVRSLETGRDAIVDTSSPGELVCGSTPCTFAPYCCSAVALEDGTSVLTVGRRAVMEALERDPEIARALLHEMGCRGMRTCGRVEELSSGQVAQRIAKLLLKLADRAGVPRPREGTWIPVPLTRQDIADVCNTTVESAIRVMTRWSREGLVRRAARGLVIVDRSRLEAIAGAAASKDAAR